MDITIANDLRLFGLDPNGCILFFKGCVTIEDVRSLLKSIKRHIKLERRKLAKKLHPDVRGDHAKMARVNEAYDRLMKLKVEVRKPVVTDVKMWNPGVTATDSGIGSTYGWTSSVHYGAGYGAGSGLDQGRGVW